MDQLTGIDQDRAQAIVKAVSQYGGWAPSEIPIEFVPVSTEAGLLMVKSCQALRNVPGLQLVEVFPGRYLIALPQGTAVEALELALGDIKAEHASITSIERTIVDQLLGILRNARHSQKISTIQVLLTAPLESV